MRGRGRNCTRFNLSLLRHLECPCKQRSSRSSNIQQGKDETIEGEGERLHYRIKVVTSGACGVSKQRSSRSSNREGVGRQGGGGVGCTRIN